MNMQEITRLFTPLNTSYFLFGPRGTGKSTLMRRLYTDALWINFLNPQTEREYEARPEMLYDYVAANSNKQLIVIDEVQKVPKILSIVHDLIEQKTGKLFVLTGSSARKIKRMQGDMLAGRALSYYMHPFMASELGSDFNLQNALQFGMLPLIYQAEHKESALQAYISLYLNEEIKMEGLTRNIGDFSRFLEAISFSHGQIINISNIARDCSVNRKTTENYINILEDLLLLHRIPIFSKKSKRELINSDKIYLFDAGVYRALRPKRLLDVKTEIDGHGLEGLVLQHLIAWRDYSKRNPQIFFWQTRSKVEVDFVVYSEDELVAIEVKNTTNINFKDVKALKAFATDYEVAKTVLLYMGTDRIMYNNILCIPVAQFLAKLKPNVLLKDIIDTSYSMSE